MNWLSEIVLVDGPVQRLFVAFVFSFLVGLERHSHGRAAGLRTNILVGLASCLAMLIPEYFMPIMPGANSGGVVDPTRIAAGALTGVGFLGAGVIIKDGASVTGLTTAACVWMVCVIGMSIGSGLYFPAAVVLALTAVTLTFMRSLERAIPEDRYRVVRVELVAPTTSEDVIAGLNRVDIKHKLIEQHIDKTTGVMECAWTVRVRNPERFADVVDVLQKNNGVRVIHVTHLTGD